MPSAESFADDDVSQGARGHHLIRTAQYQSGCTMQFIVIPPRALNRSRWIQGSSLPRSKRDLAELPGALPARKTVH